MIMNFYVDQLIYFNTNLCKSFLCGRLVEESRIVCSDFLNGKASSHKEGCLNPADYKKEEGYLRSSLFAGFYLFLNSCFLIKYLH